MVRALVIADDLTGAGDAGLAFRKQGLSVWVSLAARGGEHGAAPDALVLSTGTRNRSESDAGAVLRGLAERVAQTLEDPAPGSTPPLVYKKIDSTLRGWVGTEIKALLDHVPVPAAWVVPSYPKQGRRLEGGVYTVHGRPLHETEFAKEVCPVPADSRVQTLLDAAGEELNVRRAAPTRERFESALDTLEADGVIAEWHYGAWDKDTHGRGWAREWLQTAVVIEPPMEIQDQYREIEREARYRRQAEVPAPVPQPNPDSLGERVRRQRRERGISQLVLAEELGVNQGHVSRVERGGTASRALRERILRWLEAGRGSAAVDAAPAAEDA
jgi:DNA-binding transcriptional regulator YiaG